jgi:hypothetical protein
MMARVRVVGIVFGGLKDIDKRLVLIENPGERQRQ